MSLHPFPMMVLGCFFFFLIFVFMVSAHCSELNNILLCFFIKTHGRFLNVAIFSALRILDRLRSVEALCCLLYQFNRIINCTVECQGYYYYDHCIVECKGYYYDHYFFFICHQTCLGVLQARRLTECTAKLYLTKEIPFLRSGNIKCCNELYPPQTNDGYLTIFLLTSLPLFLQCLGVLKFFFSS